MLKKNIGTPDRLFRFALAIVLFAIAAFALFQDSSSWSGWLALAAGIFTLFEVFASWCVFYALIGKSSCPLSRDGD
jgi:hypothetical protein